MNKIKFLLCIFLFFGWSLFATENAPVAAASKEATKIVALTFDDGPKPQVLENLLPILKEESIKATFFVNGFRIKSGNNCQIIKEMSDVGHSIQNHTFGHGNLKTMEKKYGRQWVLDDIEKNSSVIEGCTGKRPIFLRPPFWVIWPDIEKDINQNGYEILTLKVDINSQDYEWALKNETAVKIVPNILKVIKERENDGRFSHILVFHELEGTVKILPELISELKKEGYGFVTVEEFYSKRRR